MIDAIGANRNNRWIPFKTTTSSGCGHSPNTSSAISSLLNECNAQPSSLMGHPPKVVFIGPVSAKA